MDLVQRLESNLSVLIAVMLPGQSLLVKRRSKLVNLALNPFCYMTRNGVFL